MRASPPLFAAARRIDSIYDQFLYGLFICAMLSNAKARVTPFLISLTLKLMPVSRKVQR